MVIVSYYETIELPGIINRRWCDLKRAQCSLDSIMASQTSKCTIFGISTQSLWNSLNPLKNPSISLDLECISRVNLPSNCLSALLNPRRSGLPLPDTSDTISNELMCCKSLCQQSSVVFEAEYSVATSTKVDFGVSYGFRSLSHG